MTVSQHATWMALSAPEAMLALADWFYWPGADATDTLHTKDCPNSKVDPEWFDQSHAVVVRTLPNGKGLCLQCANEVLKGYSVQEGAQ